MRLIDADLFYENLVKEYPQMVNGFSSKINTFTDNVKAILDNQPIAYDVDKVVEQLKEESYMCHTDDYSAMAIDLDDAIDIVRKGGIE